MIFILSLYFSASLLGPDLSTQSYSPPKTIVIGISGSVFIKSSIAIFGRTLGEKNLKNKYYDPSGRRIRVYKIFSIIYL